MDSGGKKDGDDDGVGGDCDDNSTINLRTIMISIYNHSGNLEEEDQRRTPSERPLRFSKCFTHFVCIFDILAQSHSGFKKAAQIFVFFCIFEI